MTKLAKKQFCRNEKAFFGKKKRTRVSTKNSLIKRLGGVKGLLLASEIMEPKFKSLS